MGSMGSRFSSAGNANDEGSGQPGQLLTRAPTTVIASPQPSASRAPELSPVDQVRSSAAATDMRVQGAQGGAVPKNLRQHNGASVVNGRQIIEALSASGVSGRTVVTRSRTSEATNSPATSDSSVVNRTMRPMPVLVAFRDVKCPICHKMIPSDDVECHLVMCLTKPRVNYNEELLAEDKDDECAICFEDLKKDDLIARLPCLCIYHKSCVDRWFEVSQSCPEHPDGVS